MTEEDFIAWRDNPATQWFMAALAQVADANEELAKADCWSAALAAQPDKIDDFKLLSLAIKAQTYRQVVAADFSMIEGWNDDDL